MARSSSIRGLAQLAPVALGATVLTLLYWLHRDFWCNALAHFLIDFTATILAGLALHQG